MPKLGDDSYADLHFLRMAFILLDCIVLILLQVLALVAPCVVALDVIFSCSFTVDQNSGEGWYVVLPLSKKEDLISLRLFVCI